MRPTGRRPTVRWLMIVVALAILSLGVTDAVRMSMRSAAYRRKADAAERMERRCRKIDVMDATTRAREAEAAIDDPFLDDPAWNRRMISYFDEMKRKYRSAAERPRAPVSPDPPHP